MDADTRRAWLDIDLGALVHNARTMAARAGKPLLPMIKADAYGLGAVAVARALESLDVWGFGIAAVREGESLRAAGIRRPILVFTSLLPSEFGEVRRLGLTPTFGDPVAIQGWVAGGGGDWHLAIDTGMSRSGVPWREIGSLSALVAAHPPAGAFTHFHSAERNDGSMQLQQERFRDAVAALGGTIPLLHAENSPGIERQSPSPWSLARPGVFLYGVGGEEGSAVRPAPVVSLRARVVEVRTIEAGDSVSYSATYHATERRRIATLACGYADGYRRALGNRGVALVRGRRATVAGVVTMDMTMVDVTAVPCEVGDVATLIGGDGDELLDVNAVARLAEMSPYELLVGLRLRVPRRYAGGDA
ncbi:MAG: alanine racemase [Gemmatimonadaceae bacterium]|nr:alanine racemase [Gemmatimonadaceae bacterium]